MTAAAYTTDLTLLSNCESTTGWTGSFGGISLATDTDAFIQGTQCLSSQDKSSGVAGSFYNNGGSTTIPTDGAYICWGFYAFPGDVSSEATGGFRLLIGSSTTAYNHWYVGGSDVNPYGGWKNFAVNPTVTRDANTGSPSGTLQYFGFAVNTTVGTSKGTPWSVDASYYGRCEARFAGGTGADTPCSFSGFATTNDNVNNRWGLIQYSSGVYLWKGLMVIGYAANCRFNDTGSSISVDNTKKVTANFNTIEVRQAGTEINWTGTSILGLGTVSPGRWITTDDANVNLTSCSFATMGTFQFLSKATVSSTFRGCQTVTANSANLQGSSFSSYRGASNTSALAWGDNADTNGKLDGCVFTHGSVTNSCHGLELSNTSLTSITLTNVTFNGYSTANGNPNSAVHVMKSSGSLTINITGGTTPSILTEGAAVTVVSGAVDISVHTANSTGSAVSGARVILRAANSSGPFPYQESVTITNSGNVATVHHTTHGMADNDKVEIDGASLWENNGVFSITVANTDYYTYQMPDSPGSSPTGSIIATFVALEGLTDGGGDITTSRVYSSNQPVTGWARKSSSSPYYKTSPLSGEVDSALGYSATAIMIKDE